MTFTLITGDRVSETAQGAISIAAGPGRSGMQFVRRRSGQARYVFPADALGLIGSGQVDVRLFDITTLRKDGFDDRRSPKLPLLVQSKAAGTGRRVATRSKAAVTRELAGSTLAAVKADKGSRARLWQASVRPGKGQARTLSAGLSKIWLDGKRRLSDDVSNAQIGVPAVWKKGLTGAGVPVAVLDSGIDLTHPDLKSQVAEAKNFTTDADIDDKVGHGTHVAGIIAGTGAASAGRYRGVAPGARLMIGKVCSESDVCSDSNIIAGMQWAAQRSKVINMSLGSQDTPGTDPVEQAITDLTAKYGSLFVVAAGNEGGGPYPGSAVGSPGSVKQALTVGAVDADDKIASFSSIGPGLTDQAIKPDLTAPGVNIIAAKAVHGYMGDPAADGYTAMDGTSMAAPHVAGVAAILTGLHPRWSAARRKQALMASAESTPGVSVFHQGAGRVDAAAAVQQNVTVDGGSLSFGRQAWPHADDKVLTKKVTYRNSGTKPLKLKLTLSPAPRGFALGAHQLRVPVGGTASTTLRVDTRGRGKDGMMEGHLLATGAGRVQVRTPYAVNKEIESYDVTLKYRARDGKPTVGIMSALMGVDVPYDVHDMRDKAGSVTFRVPRGTYALTAGMVSGVETTTKADDSSTVVGQPRLLVNRAMTMQVDARKAKPVRVTVPPKDAVSLFSNAEMIAKTRLMGDSSTMVDTESITNLYVGRIGPRTKATGFHTQITATFARPGLNSPYLYQLLFMNRDRVLTGFTRKVRNSDLAAISATYTSAVPDSIGSRTLAGTFGPESNWESYSSLAQFTMPFHRKEYVSTAPGLGWASWVYAESPAGTSVVDVPRRAYPAGKVTTETFTLDAPTGN